MEPQEHDAKPPEYSTYTEYERAKGGITDAYFKIVNFCSSCYTRFANSGQISNTELHEWRTGVRAMLMQIERYEKKYADMSVEEIDESLKTIPKLAKFTRKLLSSKSISDVLSIGKLIKNFDDIAVYEEENYGKK